MRICGAKREAGQNSLRFKMGNYRTKFIVSRAGIKDVVVNTGKHSRTNPEGAASRATIKRPKTAIVVEKLGRK